MGGIYYPALPDDVAEAERERVNRLIADAPVFRGSAFDLIAIKSALKRDLRRQDELRKESRQGQPTKVISDDLPTPESPVWED